MLLPVPVPGRRTGVVLVRGHAAAEVDSVWGLLLSEKISRLMKPYGIAVAPRESNDRRE